MPKRYDAWLREFEFETVTVAGIVTAIYAAPAVDLKPTVLFVHGINGDYHGMVPVAYELREDCRVVFVDLPGHGETKVPPGNDPLAALRGWSRDLPRALRERGLDIVAAVGHSFGAYVVQETNIERMALLNPPLGATSLSRHGTALLRHAPSVVARAYGSYRAMVRRGHWLMHTRTTQTNAIIAWSSSHTHVTNEQFRFQARLADTVAPMQVMDIPRLSKVPHVLVVRSTYDRVVDNSKTSLDMLERARVIELPTDHVSIFELPAEVASAIRELLKA